jgi:hypothetical protein
MCQLLRCALLGCQRTVDICRPEIIPEFCHFFDDLDCLYIYCPQHQGAPYLYSELRFPALLQSTIPSWEEVVVCNQCALFCIAEEIHNCRE